MPKKSASKKVVPIKKKLPRHYSSKSVTDTLKVLREVKKRETAAKKKPTLTPSRLSSRKVYSVRDLPIQQTGTMADLLKRIETQADELDKLKKPGEFWAAKFFGAKTYQVYTNIDLLVKYISRYEAIVQNGAKKGKYLKQLIENVKFLKFAGTSKQWVKGKEKEVEQREAKEKKLRKDVAEGKKAKKQLQKERKQADKLKRELKDMKKKLAKATKAATKKRGKK